MEQQKLVFSEKTNKDDVSYQDEPELRFPEFNEKWNVKTIKSVAQVIGGGTPKTDNVQYWDGEINWFTPSEIGNKYIFDSERKITEEGLKKSSAKLLPINSILLSTRATIGETSIIKKESTTNQGFQSLVVKENYNYEFIYYLIQLLKNEMLKRSSGSTFLEISKKEVEKILIKTPNLDEQNKIAQFLSAVDKKIELLEKKQEAYENFYYSILNRIFKKELSFSNQNTWEEVTLGELGKFFRGHSYNSSNVVEDGLVVLRSNNIQNNKLIFEKDQLQQVNKDCKDEIKLQKNDIVICMSNGTKSLVGKSAVYEGNFNRELTIGAFCSIFRSSYPLSKYLLRISEYKRYLYLILAGTNINNLKNEDMKKFKFSVPTDNDEINKIDGFLKNFENKIISINNEIDYMRNFKKGLLQKMFV